MRIAIAAAMVISACLPVGAATPTTRIDHVILGINDLDQGMASFEQLTGVRPVYGGKHPGGTHNALVSLGNGLYVEIIATQPDATPPDFLADLNSLRTLTPVGWAVSATTSAEVRRRMDSAGIPLTKPSAGSRATPAGATLSWESLDLQEKFDAAPFFIVWGAQSPHPSTTSPTGCKLQQWRIAGPNHGRLEQLRRTLDLPIDIADAPASSLRLSLACPKGSVTFESGPAAR